MAAAQAPLPPEGYLGASGRLGGGPAPELVEGAYGLEITDVALLQPGSLLADAAHLLELERLGLVTEEDVGRVFAGLLWLDGLPTEALRVEARYGDLYNVRERLLETRVGEAAGWLAAGRTRREAGRVAFKLALRRRLLDLAAAMVRFVDAIVIQAERNADALMADYTYLQAAQPSTFGHYQLSFAYPMLRGLERLRRCHQWASESPAGVGGMSGGRLGLDRERLAQVLGFARPAAHARDAMWEGDSLVEIVAGASGATTTASRMAEDLEIYSSEEFGLVRIADEYCRASAYMPQKRNAYALPVIRGTASLLIGRLAGAGVLQRTPSARTDNWILAYGETAEAVDLATTTMRLAAGVIETLTIDRERMAQLVDRSFANAADLAEALAVQSGCDYRNCYRAVGRAVAVAIDAGEGPAALDAAAIESAARALGVRLDVPQDVVLAALDVRDAVAARDVVGGAAPPPMARMLADCERESRLAAAWIAAERERAEWAELSLRSLIEDRAGHSPGDE